MDVENPEPGLCWEEIYVQGPLYSKKGGVLEMDYTARQCRQRATYGNYCHIHRKSAVCEPCGVAHE